MKVIKEHVLCLRIEKQTYEKIKQLAKERNMKVPKLLREIIEDNLDWNTTK